MSDERSNEKKGNFKPFPEQNQDGVDMSLIRRNLEMTPYERVVQAERYAKEVRWIHAHARRTA